MVAVTALRVRGFRQLGRPARSAAKAGATRVLKASALVLRNLTMTE
jgi:hypothetical protein